MRHEVADPVSPGTDSAARCACAAISGSTLLVTMTGGHGKSCESMLALDRVVEEELERCHSGVNDISCLGIGQTSCCP